MASGARLVILGKQGAGKGTQCARLSRHYGVPHIATGDMFRTELKSGSEAGQRLAKFMRAGELIPDDVVIEVVGRRLERDATKESGFILDGFPRTAPQAEELSSMLRPFGDLDMAVDIVVPTEVVMARLAGRRACRDCGRNYGVGNPPAVDWTCDACGGEVVQREDDTVEVIRRRLELYEERTEPLIAWYLGRDKLVSVDGLGTTDEVTARLVRAIDQRRERRR